MPRSGAEVGAVGPKSLKSGVGVDEIIPLSIEYKHGPYFRMSASDLAKLAVSVESVQADPFNAIVGFYRSQRRGNDMSETATGRFSRLLKRHTFLSQRTVGAIWF